MSFAAWAEAVYCNYTDSKQQQWSYYVNDSESPEYVTITNVWAPSSTTELVFPNSLPYGEAFYPVKEIKSNGTGGIASYEVKNSVTSIKLPSNLTAIIDYEGAEEYNKYQSGAFYSFQSLNSITIPASLTSIGQYTFNECWSLSTIYMEATTPPAYSASVFHSYMMPPSIIVPTASLASYKASEDWKDYVYCQEEMVDHTYTDANGVTWTYRLNITDSSVRVSSATGYTTELIFPASIAHDGKDMPIEGVTFGFDNNENIIKVDLSATQIKSIRMGGGAWGGSPSLYFNNCPSLQTVILPSTLEEIGSSAFSYCPNLQTINWTNLTALKNIGSGAFQSDWNNRFTRITAIDLSFTQLESIGSYAFQEFDNLQEIKFPSSLETIGNNAFESCNQLRDIDLSHTKIATIESQTFRYCSLETVKLPSSLKKIASYAFASNNLRDINLSNVEVIEERAFESCSNLQEIDLSSVTSVGLSAFTNNVTVTINSTTPASIKANSFTDNTKFIVTTDAYNAFCTAPIWSNWANNISMYNVDANGVKWIYRYLKDSNSMCVTSASNYGTEVTVPSSVLFNGANVPVTQLESAFTAANISSVTLPSTLTTLGRYAFSRSKITSIAIPTSVTSIGYGAFQGCRNLGDVTFAEESDLQTIGSYAFYDCDSLTSIEFPTSLTALESAAFNNCDNITSIDLSETSITKVDSAAFSYCVGLNEILLPTTITEIKDYAFYNCDRIQLVDLSSTNVKGIGNEAFRDCERLNSIIFPVTLETIGRSAFSSCQQLSSIDLSNTQLTTINDGAFNCCYYLNTVSLPSSLKKIGVGAFSHKWNPLSINLSNVEEFGDQAFYDVPINNADLSSAKTIGANVFNRDATFTINAATPATIKVNSFTENSRFIVTTDAYEKFCTAPTWKNWANNISMYNVDENGIKWIYRYLKDSNSMCITSASNYGTEVTIPDSVSYNGTDVAITQIENAFAWSNITSVTLPATLTCIGNSAFSGSKLTSVNIPASVTSIGASAFYNCDSLNSVVFPSALAKLEGSAFQDCDKLEEVDLSSTAITEIASSTFSNCDNLEEVLLPTTITQIKGSAFSSSYKLKKINFPQSLKTIGGYAFNGCYGIKSVDLSKVETIGEYAFAGINLASVDLSSAISVGYNAFAYAGGEPFFKINNATPATIASEAFPMNSMFLVPDAAVTTYKTANVWSNYASRIFASNVAVQSINVTAQAKGSGVLEAIGGSVNQTNIIDLKVKGTINGYDFVMFKDKMLNLRFLDLSEATVVYNPYCYYEYNYSQNDTLGAYAFNQENKLVSIKLPKGIKHIGSYAFAECYSLREVVFGDKLESIANNAFSNCSNLDDITLPNGLRYIGSDAFSSCNNLSNLTLPNTVKRIEYGTFQSCYNLKELTFPNQLEYIGGYAFCNTGLKEVYFPTTLKTIDYGAFQSSSVETVRIPSSLEYVREGAFQWCSNLKHVYTCTIEPTDINENTFSTFETANLYVPKASGQNYYWDEGWKRFLNIWEFDEEYLYFYLNGDHTLDESTGAVDGTPEADLNAGSGLIVEEEVEQNMSDLNINHDGENGGSIIAGSAEGNVHADSLHVNINVQSGRWYFFSFPFDLKKKDISMANEETQYVFRRYNGEKRAEGNSGWENVEEVDGYYLRAGVGYIFQCNQYDVLTISLADVTFKKEDKNNELEGHASGNVQDASWNFVGNPYLSYYDMSAIGYDAPITIWNGYSYEAIKPGDDDYQFAPFEAFFVQKPEGTDAMEFDGDEQTTYRGSQAKADAARARRRTQAIDSERLLVNLTISNGQETDRTRIVFNNNVSMGYEMACDAAKFEAAGVPQLYTIDSRAVKYAINERPVAEGIVTLGYSVPVQGNYTLAAPRMDTPVAVKDNLTGTIHNFSDGDYEFASEAGVFEDRFTVIMKAGETSIDNVGIRNQESEIYNVKGQRVNSASEQGIYIKNNRKVVKM